MKRNLLLSAVSALLLCAAVMPASASDCPGFLPPNDLKIPVGSAQDKGMIEAQFNEVLTTLEKIYKPLIAAQGKVLQINRLWTNDTVNANTSQPHYHQYVRRPGPPRNRHDGRLRAGSLPRTGP